MLLYTYTTPLHLRGLQMETTRNQEEVYRWRQPGTRNTLTKATTIIQDSSHPGNHLFTLLPLGGAIGLSRPAPPDS